MLPFVSQAFIGFMLFTNHGGNDLQQAEQLADTLYPTIITCQASASLERESRAVCGMVVDHSQPSIYESLGMVLELRM